MPLPFKKLVHVANLVLANKVLKCDMFYFKTISHKTERKEANKKLLYYELCNNKMPAILSNSFTNRQRRASIFSCSSTSNRSSRSSLLSTDTSNKTSLEYNSLRKNKCKSSGTLLTEMSSCNDSLSDMSLISNETCSSFLLQSESRMPLNSFECSQELRNKNDEDWGYFIDIMEKDDQIERYSRVLYSRNVFRRNLKVESLMLSQHNNCC